jgi:hypothetical protein
MLFPLVAYFALWRAIIGGTDGEAALHGRGPLASGSRFLFITNASIDSVNSTPGKKIVKIL